MKNYMMMNRNLIILSVINIDLSYLWGLGVLGGLGGLGGLGVRV